MTAPNAKSGLRQHETGYRYNQDSFLLADFFRPPAEGVVGDFCAGAGVVSLLAGKTHPAIRIVALEINPAMANMAAKNLLAGGTTRRHVVAGDVMEAPRLFKGRPFSAIISNPPYRVLGKGKLNPDPAKALARHEIKMTLRGLVEAASLTLSPGGALTIVMLMERLEEYRRLLGEAGFCETRHRQIRHYQSSPAKLFMSEAKLGPGNRLVIEPPFILAQSGGWTEEYKKVMEQYGG